MKKNKNELKIGVIISYLNMGIGFIIYIFLTPYIIRRVGVDEYGIYTLILSVINYLNLLELGLSSAYLRYYLKFSMEKDSLKLIRLNSMFLIVFVVVGLIGTLISYILSLNPQIILKKGISMNYILLTGQMLKIVCGITMIYFCNIIFNCYLIAHERFCLQRTLQLIKMIITAIGTIVILNMSFGIKGILLITMSSNFFTWMLLVFVCNKKLEMKFNFKNLSFGLIKEIFVFSSFIFLQMLMDQFLWNIDKLIISKLRGVEEVAIYSLASEINSYYILVAGVISNIFIAKVNKIVFNDEWSEIEKNRYLSNLVAKIGRIQLFILLPIVLSLYIYGYEFILFWLGKKYRDSYIIILVLIIPLTLPLVEGIGIQIERAKNMQKFMCIVGFIIAVINFIVSIPLVKYYGGIGAAVGTGISLFIGFVIIRNWYYKKKLGLDIKYILAELLKLGVLIPVILVVGFLLKSMFKIENILELMLQILCVCSVYMILAWFFVFNSFEKNLILGPLKKLQSNIRR